MRNRHKKIRKELVGVVLLPLPVIVYIVGRFVLDLQRPEYAAYAAGIILFVELLLLKTDISVVRKGTQKRVRFSLVRKKKSHVKTKQKRARHKNR